MEPRERLTPELIERFLDSQGEKGRGESTAQIYRSTLKALYDYLPDGKALDAETGRSWKAWLDGQGLAHRTVNAKLSVWNSFVRYLGYPEWQTEDFWPIEAEAQPRLTREEYLRMLSTARALELEREYLLVKTLGGVGVRLQELSQLTAEAVREGRVRLERRNRSQCRLLSIPDPLRRELLDYLEREHISRGPVFRGQNGEPLSRVMAHRYVSRIGREARVPEEKSTPRCLWRMYEGTRAEIRDNVYALMERAYELILEEEQLAVGWLEL